MNLITQRGLIRAVARRWAEQYRPRNGMVPMKIHLKTGEKLAQLDGETATVEEVNKIIGNNSWTRLTCNECGAHVTAVIEVGEPSDYESRTAHLCRPCLERALEFLAREDFQ